MQLSSVVDGCDGELARLRHLATARGGWLDTMLDRYADAAVVVGITVGYAAGHPGVLPWLGGMAAITGFLLASYATKEYALSHGAPYPNDWLNRVKRPRPTTVRDRLWGTARVSLLRHGRDGGALPSRDRGHPRQGVAVATDGP